MPSVHESMFQNAATPVLQEQFGVTVVLTRGSQSTGEFTARRNDRQHKAMGLEFGLEITVTMRDFLLPIESVMIDDELITPRTGDRIIDGSETFEIQPPGKDTPSVELPTGGIEYLVHTRKVA